MEDYTPVDDRATEAAAHRRIERWDGLAEQYDAYRSSAPDVLPNMLAQLAGTPVPAHVVDLGAGTGLSTLIWAGCAEQVTGIEPNDDMRRQAEARLAAIPGDERRGVRFVVRDRRAYWSARRLRGHRHRLAGLPLDGASRHVGRGRAHPAALEGSSRHMIMTGRPPSRPRPTSCSMTLCARNGE